MRNFRLATALLGMVSAAALAQTTAATAPQKNSSYIDAQGTAHVTRVAPVPTTISPEAQKVLAQPASDAALPETNLWRTAEHIPMPGRQERAKLRG
jgi:hypothetical protein